MSPGTSSRKNHAPPPPSPPPPPPPPPKQANGNGNGIVSHHHNQRLTLNPNSNHKPDSYEDLQLEFSPLLFSSLERYLPSPIINTNRQVKVQYMSDILHSYSAGTERTRVQRHREYRQRILSSYQPRYKELYTLSAEGFFVPSFLRAINENTVQGFRNIMVEPISGVFTFDMLHQHFCDLLLSEVENFERWIHETKARIMRPNTMNKYGVVLDDFGMETMLEKFMNDFISPLSRVFFPEVGGFSLDSHHGFVVEYGINRDADLGLHVDDSEVTLNVCLGRDFSGGELFFRGVRCDNHMNSETSSEDILDYSHVPGRAVLHRGCHRHGTKATTSGHRVNLLLWCRSSVYREQKKHQKDCSIWCRDCKNLKKEKHRVAVNATQVELLKRLKKSTT